MHDVQAMKRAAARAALERVEPGSVLGVGSGTTAEAFIEELSAASFSLEATVPSSERTAELLRDAGLPVLDLSGVSRVDLYVDGADEIDPALRLVKGRGGALVREKLLASIADRFIVIADESKRVDSLGSDSVPIEVLPAAAAAISRRFSNPGTVQPRQGKSDNGNIILDVIGLDLSDPVVAEVAIESLPGVVGSGIFARRPADEVLVGTAMGVISLEPE